MNKIDNKNMYGHYKEIKEFKCEEEASKYFDDKIQKIYDKKVETGNISNGDTVVKLSDFIKNQGYSDYKLVK